MGLDVSGTTPEMATVMSLRTSPPGYQAIQDDWADDFLIRTTPVEHPPKRVTSPNQARIAAPLQWYLWGFVLLVIILTLIAMLVAQ